MTSFKLKPIDKYVSVEYVLTDTTNISRLLLHKAEVWCLNEEEAKHYIKVATDIEKLISLELKKRNLPYDTVLIMLTWMGVIESIASGLDIRSKLPLEVNVSRFIDSYDKRYNEALNFCNETLEYVSKVPDDETYTKNWRRYEKHNELVLEFALNLKQVKDTDFKINLGSILDSLEKFKELFGKD